MSIAAVPEYMSQDSLAGASPGLRFGMYLKLWGVDTRGGSRNWETHDLTYRATGQDKRERSFETKNKASALSAAAALKPGDKALMDALCARQLGLSKVLDVNTGGLLRIEAVAIAPFTTGLGNEHPLKNGFSFLSPYGLPYLPGSSIKGVLRQAVRELAQGEWESDYGWTEGKRFPVNVVKGEVVSLSMIDVLFGLQGTDGETEQFRGVLTFLDVVPHIAGDSLRVEVMTPHQAHYYQKGDSPHDSGQPDPITFLTVPPGSGFVFDIRCDVAFLRRVAPDLVDEWQSLVSAAMQHAFQWLGFGAKTAVGYGAMQEDPQVAERRARAEAERRAEQQRQEEQRRRAQELAEMSPAQREIAKCLDDRVDKNQRELTCLLRALKDGRWQDDVRRDVALEIKAMLQKEKKWRETSAKKNPEKDYDYQDTLLVKKAIDGS